MQGLAALHENVVGHVHDIGNGTHAHRVQPVPDAHGRRRNFAARDDAAGVEPAEIRVPDVDGRQLHGRPVLHALALGDAERQAEGLRRFSGKPDDRKAVRAVGRDGDVQHFAIEFQGIHQQRAGDGRLRQHHDAGMVFRKAQFAFGADHAAARRAAQLGLLDDQPARHGGAHQRHGHLLPGGHVGGPADDVQQLALSGIHLADVQMVRFGMIDAFHHVAHHDGGDGVIGTDDLFQFQPQHGQAVAEFLRRTFVGDKFTQPRQGKQHTLSHWPQGRLSVEIPGGFRFFHLRQGTHGLFLSAIAAVCARTGPVADLAFRRLVLQPAAIGIRIAHAAIVGPAGGASARQGLQRARPARRLKAGMVRCSSRCSSIYRRISASDWATPRSSIGPKRASVLCSSWAESR